MGLAFDNEVAVAVARHRRMTIRSGLTRHAVDVVPAGFWLLRLAHDHVERVQQVVDDAVLLGHEHSLRACP